MANELELLFSSDEIKNRPIPILFYANKCDDQRAQETKYFVNFLNLDKINERPW